MEHSLYDRSRLIASLLKIPHGDLSLFTVDALPAAKADPELFAHLTAWNHSKGKVRDSKVALPVLALRGLAKEDTDFAVNAVAHLLSLDPRELSRAYQYSKVLTAAGHHIPGGHRRLLESGLKQYLAIREANEQWWDRTVLQHRQAMTALYAIAHYKPSPRAQAILFEKRYPVGSVFATVKMLKTMNPREAAGTILQYKIPMQIAVGAVAKLKDPDVILALLEGMSGNEVLNSSAMLTKLGVMDSPPLKAAYDAAIERAKEDKRVNTYRASTAVKSLDEKTAVKVMQVQRSQERKLSGIDGNWLVIGDKSGSMQHSVEVAKQVAAVLASQVKGQVTLVFVNSSPQPFAVTSKTYDEIATLTKYVRADGGTNLGCGLDYVREKGMLVDGIVLVSDGGENNQPWFSSVYHRYCEQFHIEPSVTLFHVPGDENRFAYYCTHHQPPVVFEMFDLGSHVDMYSLPNLVSTLKAGRHTLVDEVMVTPLLTLTDVFHVRNRKEVSYVDERRSAAI